MTIKLMTEYQNLLEEMIWEINYNYSGTDNAYMVERQHYHFERWLDLNNELKELNKPHYTQTKAREVRNLLL